jgi:hypothetical protein
MPFRPDRSPQVELLEDGRSARLLHDFKYIDPFGRAWVARKGLTSDGASIPRIAHRIRAPWTGKHRLAALPHDQACVDRVDRWQDVHRMYWNALKDSGEPFYIVWLMGWAVWLGGPRWKPPQSSI